MKKKEKRNIRTKIKERKVQKGRYVRNIIRNKNV